MVDGVEVRGRRVQVVKEAEKGWGMVEDGCTVLQDGMCVSENQCEVLVNR